MKIISAGSDRGNRRNEDLWGQAGDYVWLLDGATGLGPSRFDEMTEAEWFVAQVSAYLQDAKGDTRTVLAGAINAARSAYAGLGEWPENPATLPSAGLMMVRRDGDEIEFASLADVKAYVIMTDGTRRVFGGGAIEALDARALEILRQVQADHGPLDLTAARVHLDPTLKAHRAKMNTEGGYWVLGLDPACLQGLEVTRLPAQSIRHILLATDGFYDLWEQYGADFDTVLARLIDGEGDAVVAELRAIERADPDAVRYARFKLHDDASWVLIEV